jgi:hypothetical protein
MSLPLSENKNILIISSDKDFMLKLRNSITDTFKRIWMLLYYDNFRNQYGIEVCDDKGFVLDNDIKNKIIEHIDNFKKENKYGQ